MLSWPLLKGLGTWKTNVGGLVSILAYKTSPQLETDLALIFDPAEKFGVGKMKKALVPNAGAITAETTTPVFITSHIQRKIVPRQGITKLSGC